MADKATEENPTPIGVRHKLAMRGLDAASTFAFLSAGVLGAIGVANEVRHTFWNNFVQGFGNIKTPFQPLHDQFNAQFQSTSNTYQRGAITAQEYSQAMHKTGNEYRAAVADKLLKEFDIPTDGVKGWTVGTYKRMKEIGTSGRIYNTIGFATVAASAIGAVAYFGRDHLHEKTFERLEENKSR